jgi:hypothetical protein
MTRFELETRLSAELCRERLSRGAQSESLLSWFGRRRAFVIRVSGGRLRLRYRSGSFRNAFSPLFYGVIESRSSGARIKGTFRIHPLSRAFAWLWFGLVSVIGAVLLGASVRAVWQGNSAGFDGPLWGGLVTGPGLVLLGVALLRSGRYAHVREITAFLSMTTEGRVTSDDAP